MDATRASMSSSPATARTPTNVVGFVRELGVVIEVFVVDEGIVHLHLVCLVGMGYYSVVGVILAVLR